MAKIRSQYIAGVETLSDEALIEALSATESHAIANVNWAEYPYKPSVDFHIAHSDKAIAIMFKVTEDHVKAVAMEDNGPVWEDSCVEFFIRTADGKHYINFEMNCAGTLLAARRTSRHDPTHFGPEQFEQVRRINSLPHEEINSIGEGQSWWAIEVIPFSLLGYEQTPAILHANLYKCGDKCDQPHFLSWSPISTPTPNFHCPEFFGQIEL